MIVSRAPTRFSLGGGGTDLLPYSSRFGGFVVSAAIDKYVYVCCNPRFYRDIRLAYSKTEIAPTVDDIEHPIFREALRMRNIEHSIELVSVADVPASSGLGSSSSFTVGLLNALHAYKRELVSSRQLAEEACVLEIDRLKEPIGRQDQYIAAFGGVTAFTFHPDGAVDVEPVRTSEEVLGELENNLVIVYSGVERSARTVLTEQGRRIAELEPEVIESMHHIKALGHEVTRLLERGDVDAYGDLLHAHWTRKRTLTSNMTDATIDETYEAARKAGALGGKIMGAGAGGFFMFYVRPERKRALIETVRARGLRTMRFRFDYSGATIIANMLPR